MTIYILLCVIGLWFVLTPLVMSKTESDDKFPLQDGIKWWNNED